MDNLKIIILDDDSLIRKTLTKLLEKENHKIYNAENGYEAIDIVNKNVIDIVITDIQMPEIDGLKTIEEIKKISPNTKFVVITGYSNDSTPIKAIRLGVNDYIYKPFELEEFIYCIKRNQSIINLEKKNIELERENIMNHKLAAVGTMTNSIVHDIKNALTTVGGFAKMLKNSDLEREKMNRFIDIIINQTNVVMEKLVEILDFSRGEIGLKFELEAISEIYEDILIENRDIMDMENIEFNIFLSNNLKNKKIYTDKKRLKQIINNLLSNAKDAMDKDKKKIDVKLNLKNEDIIYIEISDNGKGIKKEYLNKIFLPFETFDKKQGTGLGLSIVKQIIEKNNGTIEVESKEEVGTTFKIELPLNIENLKILQK